MATIPKRRGYALGSHGKGGPPREYLPAVASLSANAGDVLTGAGGYASHASANVIETPAPASGILEVNVTSASANDPVLCTLVLPAFRYEFTLAGTAAADQRLGAEVHELKDGTTGLFAVVNDADSNSGVVNIINFCGNLAGEYVTHEFNPAEGDSTTSGATNRPDASLGIVGDTDARCVVVFNPAGCALTRT